MNFDDMDRELEDLFKQNEISRVGTGEFTDSLIWEPWVDRTVCLVKKFSQQRKAVLELKTKTISVDKLIGLDHNRKTILAWSLNTERIIASDEKYTTPLEKRIKTAQECAALGYPVAFHFDPIVIYEGCQDEYRSVVSRLLASVPASSIAYISLGTFRYIPSLKKIIESRFPESRIVYGEFIPGLDGKMRYFKPLRLRIYKEIYNTIMSLAPDVFVYYCMEDSEIWDKTMGFIPEEKGGLGRMLDRRVAEICGLDI
jgi:spore photoproduct lyase